MLQVYSCCWQVGGFSSLLWLNNIPVCLTIFTHLSVEKQLDCFHTLAIMGIQISLWDSDFISFGSMPTGEFLGHIVIPFLIFWDTSILFSKVAAWVYIPVNGAQGFPFLHILLNSCLWSFSWWSFWQVWNDTSLWFSFVFPWWLMILSIFSFACWPSISLLEKMSFGSSTHFLTRFSFSFFLFATVLYELLIYFGY